MQSLPVFAESRHYAAHALIEMQRFQVNCLSKTKCLILVNLNQSVVLGFKLEYAAGAHT